MHIEPFKVQIKTDVLFDLQARIRNTRWPDPAPGVAWGQGTDREYLRRLLAYWQDGFDWRAQERKLNQFDHYHAEIDGVDLHFVHERAENRGGIPLILSHGWPSTFVEDRKSTRLNSSHVAISYTVFCLKKKI